MKVQVDGKHFAIGSARFPFKGVTYGTFAARDDGALFPSRARIKRDFAAIHEAGFTVVRTYTAPPDDVVELAADWGLRLLAGVFYPDWRYMVGRSRREAARLGREAAREVRSQARRLAGAEHVLGLSLGNEIPADVVRWVGTRRIARAIDDLVDVVREEDDEQLVTYANYPTAEYLPLDSLDFLTFNVFLERRVDFRRYLTRLQNIAGDRPLVLGELGLHAGEGAAGERMQADTIDWQLGTAVERGVAGTCIFSWTDEWAVGGKPVEGWQFGLTRADRTPRPALQVAEHWNARSVADIAAEWPSLSIVICAYNAAATLDECLRHTCELDYPELEIIVVDDGSTDDTAAIAARHPRARLVSIVHAGLSVARNAGYEAATGEIVAYLDSDAFPQPEWPYYLALGFDGPMVAGAGGPNVPPREDPLGAQQVAQAPGGPVHVLLADDRAEHVPGCNMAFYRNTLEEIGGFDPVYTAAGDDVDVCWKVLDRGYEIGFHPAALVWHHRRGGLRPYLRQQRGYGKAEALVEARHPDRFTPLGSARWRGRIYNSLMPSFARQRVYHGLYGAAAYQSVYRGGGYLMDIVHQVGVPVAAVMLLLAPLAFVSVGILFPVGLAVAFLASLLVVDTARAQPPAHLHTGRDLGFRIGVALLHLTQPLARTWGRLRSAASARRDLPPRATLPSGMRDVGGGVLLVPAEKPRVDVVADVVADLRRAGYRAITPSGWEDHDVVLHTSLLVAGELVTSEFPEGCIQLAVRPRLRPRKLVLGALAVVIAATLSPTLAMLLAAAGAAEIGRGAWRAGPGLRRLLQRWSASPTHPATHGGDGNA